MENVDFCRSALGICVAAALLAGCGLRPPIGAPGAMPQPGVRPPNPLADRQKAGDSRYKVVYNFKGTPDGAVPYATLTAVNGMFYGTTSSGGKNDKGCVFVISTSGNERVLYSFKGKPDGSDPKAGLIYVDGNLYGTTGGGPKGYGTVFEVTMSGKERVLHNFTNVPDGYYPLAPLIAANGALYGTTLWGGSSSCILSSSEFAGCGTVFRVTTSGQERVLYDFEGARNDGGAPSAPLLAIGDELYGTTEVGGEHGSGVVYMVGDSGKERVIYSFKGPPDGAFPTTGLIAVNGMLYGTTYNGGSQGDSGGEGTLFRMSKTGSDERVLFSFGHKLGSLPSAGVLAVKDELYGTTIPGFLGGTAYEMNLSGKDARLLHHFTGPPDGGAPNGVTYFEGALYGTTRSGGKYGGGNGNGTIFELTLPSR